VSLYDPDCLKDNDGFVQVGEEASKSRKTSRKIEKTLAALTSPESGSVPYVTAIGRFHDWNGIGHGDLKKWTYELAVMAFRKVEGRQPPDVFEPGTSEFRWAVDELHYDSEAWISAFLNGWQGKPGIMNWMTDSFELTGPDGIKAGRDPLPRATCPNFTRRWAPSPLIVRAGDALVATGETVAYDCPKKVLCVYRYELRSEKIGGDWKLVEAQITTGRTKSIEELCK
jgi:hypothetical protein